MVTLWLRKNRTILRKCTVTIARAQTVDTRPYFLFWAAWVRGYVVVHVVVKCSVTTIFTRVPEQSLSWTCHTWGRVSLRTTGDIAQGQGRCGGWQFEVLSSHGSPVGTVSSWQCTCHLERTAPSVWSAERPQRSSWSIQRLCTAVPVWGEYTTKFMATSKYSSFQFEQETQSESLSQSWLIPIPTSVVYTVTAPSSMWSRQLPNRPNKIDAPPTSLTWTSSD